MEPRSLLPLSLVVLGLFALMLTASGAGREPYDSKRHVTSAIEEVALWYHRTYGVDYHKAKQFMIEIGNQESHLGTYSTTYGAGRGDVGWGQFNRAKSAAFKDIQQRMERSHSSRVDAIQREWGFDLTRIDIDEMGYSDYRADIISAVFVREFLLLRGDEIPDEFLRRAEWWKKYYNTELGAGTVSRYVATNTDKTGWWIYAGTTAQGDKYYAREDEEDYLSGKDAKIAYVSEGVRDLPEPENVYESQQEEPGIISEPPLPVEPDEEAVKTHSSKKFVTAVIENVARWYHEELSKEYGRAYQFMIEIGNLESGLGTEPWSYEGGRKGWAQFAPGSATVFEDVKLRLGWHAGRRGAISDEWDFDPLETALEEVNEPEELADTISAVFLREFFLRDPAPVPETIEERAAWWVENYDVHGAAEDYIAANTFEDNNGKTWIYSGTVEAGGTTQDRYYLKEDEDLYVDKEGKARVDYVGEGKGDLKAYACLSKALEDSAWWRRFKNGCLWINYCDDSYSQPEASAFVDCLEDTDEWMDGGFSMQHTRSSEPEPTLYRNQKYGELGRLSCAKFAVISFMYAGCDARVGPMDLSEVGPVVPDEQQGFCIEVNESSYDDLAAALFSGVGGGKPVWAAVKDLWSRIISSDGEAERSSFSTYMTRFYPNFMASGIAYQLLPSDMEFDKDVRIEMKHDGRSITHGDGIFMYRFEDWEVEDGCEIMVSDAVTETIGPEGGTMRLGDVRLEFPEGAVSESTEITIKKLDLECVETGNVSEMPPGSNVTAGNATQNETGTVPGPVEEEGEEGADEWQYLVPLIVVVIAAVLLIHKRRVPF